MTEELAKQMGWQVINDRAFGKRLNTVAYHKHVRKPDATSYTTKLRDLNKSWHT